RGRLAVDESERIRDGDDLEDPLCRQPSVAGAHGRLGDADARGDGTERLAPVRLQRLDDAAVELVRPAGRRDRAALRTARGNSERLDVLTAHRAGFVPLCHAFRQWEGAQAALRAGG